MTGRSVRAARKAPGKRLFSASTAEWIEPPDLDDEDEDDEPQDDSFDEPTDRLFEDTYL